MLERKRSAGVIFPFFEYSDHVFKSGEGKGGTPLASRDVGDRACSMESSGQSLGCSGTPAAALAAVLMQFSMEPDGQFLKTTRLVRPVTALVPDTVPWRHVGRINFTCNS